MSTDSPSEVILTATVAIFSPGMTEMVAVINKRLKTALFPKWRILPPGGKCDPDMDGKNLLNTALRETGEEIRLALFPGTWVFLDKNGIPIIDPEPVAIEPFAFINDVSKKGRDHLYFFRLHEKPDFDLRGETQGFWYTRRQIRQDIAEIDWVKYEVLFPQLKATILAVMRWL